MTRRSLLAATAGAVAGGFARPGGALAALAAPVTLGNDARPVLFERVLGALPAGSAARSIDLRRNADLVGVRWSGSAVARVELRFGDERGGWSGWVSAAAHGHEPEGAAGPRATTGDPIWTGGGSLVQLRSDRSLGDVRLNCVDVSGGIGAHRQALAAGPLASAATPPQATPVLQAGPGQPPIIARQAWAQGISVPRRAPQYGAISMAFVHHTENSNGYLHGEVPAMLRAIFLFHRDVHGWNDIGYNFVLDRFGRIFEARAGGIDEPVVGAQAGGYNLVSTGIAVLGDFVSEGISQPARQALTHLLAWKLSLHGVPITGHVTVRVNPAGAIYSRFPANARVSLPRIAGHRDGDSTNCPGDALYGELPALRTRALNLAGRSAQATLLIQTGDQSLETATLMGAMTFLDQTPIVGAPIEIQMRRVTHKGQTVQERTIAQTTTGADGRWSLPVSISAQGPSVSLRALCLGANGIPAAVSDPLQMPGMPVFTPMPSQAPAPSPSTTAPPGM
jgi:N-acetylmuramoyl-L-alanine amidase